MNKDMVRHTGIDELVEALRHRFTVRLNQEAVARDSPLRLNRPAFKSGHVVSVVTPPEARDGDGLICPQTAIHHKRSRSVEMLAKRRAVFASDCIAHVERRHTGMPEKNSGRIVFQPIRQKARAKSEEAAD